MTKILKTIDLWNYIEKLDKLDTNIVKKAT